MNLSERLQAQAVRALVALPPAAKRRLVGPPVRIDGQELELDAQLACWLDRVAPEPHVDEADSIDEARASVRSEAAIVAGRLLELPGRPVDVAGAAGALPGRLYVPAEAAAGPGPLLVWFHGGGWVVGDLDTHDAPCRVLARAAGIRVLSVAYRLAPEHPFPAATDDALAAFRDVVERAEEFGADPAAVMVGGDSAGGHLSAMTAIAAAADGGPAPSLQLLVYPVTDLRLERHRSRELFGEGFVLTAASMDWYEHHFVSDEQRAAASPLAAASLEGVAPALVVTAGFDPLRDEGEAYAARLREAGVPALLRRHPGQIHAFINMTGFGTATRTAIGEIAGVLRAHLAAAAAVVP